MMRAGCMVWTVVLGAVAQAQTVTNIDCTNAQAVQAMKGLHDPADYAATMVIHDHAQILCELRTRISPDSLQAYLVALEGFHNRNSYSDTTSATTGIGAARRWAFDKFQQFGSENEDRLIPAYLQFDVLDPNNLACGNAGGWRNVLAVLPGADAAADDIVIIEAHMDSRCAENCDGNCLAAGMEDNGSGTALVIELARVMSRYTFDRTLVFMLTTGEEQGLLGADAMATWCANNGVAIKGVQNNDIVGGILCGNTSSPPSCPGPGDVDSLQVRLFSNSSIGQPHRGFARTIRMYYQEKMQSQVAVPMTISIMNQEDRTNRGGDHIPFRVKGYRNVRFTSANEHGDGNVTDTTYTDRQHTSDDILGVDTDGDMIVDSFFVDFHYLARNAVINGMSATLLALGPATPDFIVHDEPGGLRVSITSGFGLPWFRVGVRNASTSLEFDAVYRTSDTSFVVPGLLAGHIYYISVAGIDAAGIMSPFSREYAAGNDADTPLGTLDPLPFSIDCYAFGVEDLPAATPGPCKLLPCQPNPFRGSTLIQVHVSKQLPYRHAEIVIGDPLGRDVAHLPITLAAGTNAVVYEHQRGAGVYICSLMVDGHPMAAGRLVVLD